MRATLAPKRNPPDGYPSLAAFMASDRDRTAMIFRRFDRLSARTLLYLQSELAEMEARLAEYDEQDRAQPGARNWEVFKQNAQDQPDRMDLVKRIKESMLEYSEYFAIAVQEWRY